MTNKAIPLRPALRLLLTILLFFGVPADAAAQFCDGGDAPPAGLKRPVCCGVNSQSKWMTREECDRITAAAQSCFKSGGDSFDLNSHRCIRDSRDDRLRKSEEYADRVTFCSDRMKVMMEAVALRDWGWPQQRTADQLVGQYAYGPGGLVLRESASVQVAIRSWVSEVYSNRPQYVAGMDFRRTYDQCMRR